MRWRHHEEWISLTTDTAEGFLVDAEFQVHETPNVITILEGTSRKNRYLISDTNSMIILLNTCYKTTKISFHYYFSPQATSPDESPTTADCVAHFTSSAASILHVTSSSVGQTTSPQAPTPSNSGVTTNTSIQILLGSRHQFELYRVLAKGSGAHHILGCRGTEGVEAVKLLSVPNTDASAIGAIEATEVKCTFYNLEIIK